MTVGTLATIAAQAAERGIRSPAVVVVGDVVRLSPYAPAELAVSALGVSDELSAPLAARTPRSATHPKGHCPSDLPRPSNLRVAIVGAGPAGIYAGNILANSVTAEPAAPSRSTCSSRCPRPTA